MHSQLVRYVFYDAERFEFWTAALPAASNIVNQLLYPLCYVINSTVEQKFFEIFY